MEPQKRHELPILMRGQIIEFLDAFKDYAERSSFYGVPESTVRSVYKKFKEAKRI